MRTRRDLRARTDGLQLHNLIAVTSCESAIESLTQGIDGMLFETAEEYTTEITDVQADIRRVRKLGREHENSTGGSSRKTTEVDLPKLVAYLAQLRREQALINGPGVAVRAGW